MSEAIGELVARADPPLYVVTTVAAGERAGCVVGFATQASIDPARFLVAISKANRTWRVAEAASHVAVHLFGQERMEIVDLFGGETGDEVDKFEQCDWTEGDDGVPVLDGAVAWFIGRIIGRFDFGDHVGHLLDPVSGGSVKASPAAVTLHDADDLEPGHPA
jgi:flavin reductase (DIM6/NTAB) family NADH-FMN oxidoreductase RutF